jgi:hypothetical protein
LTLDVENLSFTFPDTWTVIKFDDTVFYRGQFGKMWEGIKAVDLVAVSDDRTAYLIEVKDYRVAREPGPKELPHLVAAKVFDTLAAQIPCKLNANEDAEQAIAKRVSECLKLVVVLHVEQPLFNKGIFRPYDPANLQNKLRELIKPIHARPLVLHRQAMGGVLWTVELNP